MQKLLLSICMIVYLAVPAQGLDVILEVCRGFDGQWNTNYGKLSFRVTGDRAVGSYVYSGIASTINATVSGNVLDGEYSQPGYPDPRYASGRVRFVLNSDGIEGQWWDANGNPGGTWNGKCVGEMTPPRSSGSATGTGTSVGAGPGSGQGSNQACNGFAGRWETNYVPLTFVIDGKKAIGSYVYSGINCTISGTINGNVLEGDYSQPGYGDPRAQRGRVRFELSGQSWSGGWYYADGVYGGNWTGKCAGSTGASSPGGGGVAAGGICDDPNTERIMDDWLARANPPDNLQPGWSVRYEKWGRLVGETPTNTIKTSGPPDTNKTRCEWLADLAPSLKSTNLGTLQEYLDKNRK